MAFGLPGILPNSIQSSQALSPISPNMGGPVGLGGGPGSGIPSLQQAVAQGRNPDGSSQPSGATGGGFGPGGPTLGGGSLTGAMAGAGYTPAGTIGLGRDMPTAILEGVLRGGGYSAGGGLGDLLYSIASPDQLNTLYALLGAGQGGYAGADYNSFGNMVSNFYNSLIGGGGGGANGGGLPPSLSSVLGPAFGGSGSIDDPFGGLLTGGTPAQQVSQLLGAVGDIAGMSMPGLVRSALMRQLQRAGAMYGEGQASGGNSTFLSWLQNQAPFLAHSLGG